MSQQLPKRTRRNYTVNIVSLVDVLIILIFFFMVTMQFRNQKVLNITPPKMETAGAEEETDRIVVTVSKTGDIQLNDVAVQPEQLDTELKAISKKSTAGNVLIIADEDSALKYVASVMDACRKADLQALRLQSR